MPREKVSAINMWAMSGEIGWKITIPLVVLVILGIKIDKILGTTPLFIILGMILALVISGIAIARMIKRVSARTE